MFPVGITRMSTDGHALCCGFGDGTGHGLRVPGMGAAGDVG
jgi:hypothetical protein